MFFFPLIEENVNLYIKSKSFQIASGATFLKGPVSQLRLAQLVAELDNSLGLMSWAVYDAKSFSSTTVDFTLLMVNKI